MTTRSRLRAGWARKRCSGHPSRPTRHPNALGQRVFKSEPQAEHTLPNQAELGSSFIDWLKKNFGWLFATAQANATLGQSYLYADDSTGLPNWALLGEYGNGGSKSTGRWEYVWLPTEEDSNGSHAIPVGVYKGGHIYALHTDHLGTPRRATNETGSLVWQWPISGFGDNKPSGYLKATQSSRQALTNEPVLLRATSPSLELNLRLPGQYFDEETGLHYNHFRSYLPGQGRYTQADPIGLGGGANRFGYVEGMPLSFVDPMGLQAAIPTPIGPVPLPITPSPVFPSPKPIDPTEPSSPTYTPGVRMPDMSPLPLPIATIGQIIYTWATSNCPSDDSGFWKGLRPYRGKTKTNGESGKGRRFYEWDYTHGDVEVYDGRGNHLGSANPATGAPTKPPVPGRRIDL